MEEALIIEVWDTFRDYIPEKNRETAASQFVDFIIGKDVELSVLESLLGYDPHLDSAIEVAIKEFKDEDEEDEEDYDYGEDAEDY
jgi:hypothetical protein